MAQQVKNPPAVQETQEMWVCSLNQEDPLEKEMETPSKYCCLGNPLDRGAWWATVHGVAKLRPEQQSTHTTTLSSGKGRGRASANERLLLTLKCLF